MNIRGEERTRIFKEARKKKEKEGVAWIMSLKCYK